jgi:sugar phosphate isomerase/epimerase
MFRIGTTSYIIPADILPNVEYLAPMVDDVELVLFEADEYGSNLPDAALCARLNEIAYAHDLTYTVHLPLDLCLGDEGDPGHISLVKAERVIAATRELAPFAYTVHLDGRPLMGAEPAGLDARFLSAWQANAVGALRTVIGWLDDPARLCIENVEAWNPDAFAPVLDAAPVSRTVDVGHLWLRGEDPLPRLATWIDRARVVHLHGVAERDHKSLAHVPAAQLDPIVAFLARHFTGVVTLEVFDQEDFVSSQVALAASLARVGGERG